MNTGHRRICSHCLGLLFVSQYGELVCINPECPQKYKTQLTLSSTESRSIVWNSRSLFRLGAGIYREVPSGEREGTLYLGCIECRGKNIFLFEGRYRCPDCGKGTMELLK